ncbi:hypothetical protein [Clostridium sp. Marseille-P2415]|uniref:hypothetical protein n=1 Tax=Clostridium sp. Marseille-P2415 TaxID=1805471 RepID=UPI0009884312|nr:hypothetical protein [Clostridium sp. Marseille-P2415]
MVLEHILIDSVGKIFSSAWHCRITHLYFFPNLYVLEDIDPENIPAVMYLNIVGGISFIKLLCKRINSPLPQGLSCLRQNTFF